VAPLQTPEQLCNAALARIGYKERIGNLYEGSMASKVALQLYAETRDEKLASFEWGFAERNAQLALLKSAPVGGYIPPAVWNPAQNPPLGWSYEFAYPGDCLKVRSLRVQLFFTPDYDPKPVEFRIVQDNTLATPAKVILCNINPAFVVYTAQVTNPLAWEPGFVETLIDALSKTFAPALARVDQAGFEAEKAGAAMEGAEAGQAEARLG
jgi:hypothetical protein